MRCYAEYKCMSQDGMIAIKPPNLTFEEAATLTFGAKSCNTALEFFIRGNLKAGERVLINGASGSVRTAAVQLAKRCFGASWVTAVCSAANEDLVRSLGADEVVEHFKVATFGGSFSCGRYCYLCLIKSRVDFLYAGYDEFGSFRSLNSGHSGHSSRRNVDIAETSFQDVQTRGKFLTLCNRFPQSSQMQQFRPS